jgi:hypothetical protein
MFAGTKGRTQKVVGNERCVSMCAGDWRGYHDK